MAYWTTNKDCKLDIIWNDRIQMYIRKTSHNTLQVGRVGYKIPCLLFLKIICCYWNRDSSYKPHGSYKAISCWNKPKNVSLEKNVSFQNEESKKVWDKQIYNPYQCYTEQPWPRKKEHRRLSDKIWKIMTWAR